MLHGTVERGRVKVVSSKALAKLVAKLAASVIDTSGNYAAGVVDTGGNFATCVIDTGGL